MHSTAAQFRRLEAEKIIETVRMLHSRIEERFPGSGLGKVVAELQQVADVLCACKQAGIGELVTVYHNHRPTIAAFPGMVDLLELLRGRYRLAVRFEPKAEDKE